MTSKALIGGIIVVIVIIALVGAFALNAGSGSKQAAVSTTISSQSPTVAASTSTLSSSGGSSGLSCGSDFPVGIVQAAYPSQSFKTDIPATPASGAEVLKCAYQGSNASTTVELNVWLAADEPTYNATVQGIEADNYSCTSVSSVVGVPASSCIYGNYVVMVVFNSANNEYSVAVTGEPPATPLVSIAAGVNSRLSS